MQNNAGSAGGGELMSGPIPGKSVTDRVRFIQHKGKSILLEDYSNLGPVPEFFETLKRAQETIGRQPEKSVLAVADVSNSTFDMETLNALGKFVKVNTPFIKCTAVVGVKGLAEVGLMAVSRMGGRSFKTYDTREAALDYLVTLE
jgi:hypothetical protein